MILSNLRALAGAGILTCTLLTGSLARADEKLSAQEKLEQEQAQIDAAVAQAGGTIARKLSAKFNLTPEVIQKMRDGGPGESPAGAPGWGEITILLSMARQLQKSHPADYPAYDDALKRISGLRAENDMAFERIAGQLELNLRPVIVEVRRIRANLLTEKRFPGK